MQSLSRLFPLTIFLSTLCIAPFPVNSQGPGIVINEYPVTIQFIHNIGKEPLVLDTICYVNLSGNKYSVETLRYFVSGITFYRPNGDSMEIRDVIYIDAGKSNPYSFLTSGNIPEGIYSGISFVFGLDKQANVTGRFLNPPENRMEWPETMGGGYHYMKLEGKFDAEGGTGNFQAHVGQLNGTPHFFRVRLQNSLFTIDHKGITVQVVMDINNWWRGTHTIDLNNVTAIMDNDRAQRQLMENGAGVFSIGSIK